MHVLITGASKGIGLSIAKRFASLITPGLRLSICSKNSGSILQARAEIEADSPSSTIYAAPCDVSQPAGVERFVSQSEKEFGPVDVLINNAGFGYFHPVLGMESSDFDKIIATNLRGVFIVTHAVLPGMKKNKSGTIVAVSSLAGKNGFSGGAAYCTSKFGVRGLMQSLFLDVREHNIRVITIFPGSVDTDFFATAGAGFSTSSTMLVADDIASAVFAAVSLHDNATISELEIRPTNPGGRPLPERLSLANPIRVLP